MSVCAPATLFHRDRFLSFFPWLENQAGLLRPAELSGHPHRQIAKAVVVPLINSSPAIAFFINVAPLLGAVYRFLVPLNQKHVVASCCGSPLDIAGKSGSASVADDAIKPRWRKTYDFFSLVRVSSVINDRPGGRAKHVHV